MNSKQRRKVRRQINPKMTDFQRQIYAGFLAEKRLQKWWRKNPLGSENNPYIVSPAVYKLMQEMHG